MKVRTRNPENIFHLILLNMIKKGVYPDEIKNNLSQMLVNINFP